MNFQLSSKAFRDGEPIPDLYSNTRLGKNISPPLRWENPPGGDNPPKLTKSYALIAEDVDAPVIGIISHWVLFNIPPDKRELPENIPHQASLTDGSIQGLNFHRQNGYMGPSPPFGTHRYYFKIYALDIKLPTDPKMNRRKLLKAMENHILGQAQLMGRYSKK